MASSSDYQQVKEEVVKVEIVKDEEVKDEVISEEEGWDEPQVVDAEMQTEAWV
jgi:hypothetical protein